MSGHPVGGWDLFDGWPNWNDFTHQQMYSDWVKRAHDGGTTFTADRVLTLAEAQGYPVVAGHTGVIDASLGAKRHEGQKTAAQLARILALGGLLAPILHQGSTDGIRYEPHAAPGAPVRPGVVLRRRKPDAARRWDSLSVRDRAAPGPRPRRGRPPGSPVLRGTHVRRRHHATAR